MKNQQKNYRNGYISAVSALQLSVKREKLFEWNKILCSVMTAQNNNNTFLIPKNRWDCIEIYLFCSVLDIAGVGRQIYKLMWNVN